MPTGVSRLLGGNARCEYGASAAEIYVPFLRDIQ